MIHTGPCKCRSRLHLMLCDQNDWCSMHGREGPTNSAVPLRCWRAEPKERRKGQEYGYNLWDFTLALPISNSPNIHSGSLWQPLDFRTVASFPDGSVGTYLSFYNGFLASTSYILASNPLYTSSKWCRAMAAAGSDRSNKSQSRWSLPGKSRSSAKTAPSSVVLGARRVTKSSTFF